LSSSSKTGWKYSWRLLNKGGVGGRRSSKKLEKEKDERSSSIVVAALKAQGLVLEEERK
jgi:hypothetical protein